MGERKYYHGQTHVCCTFLWPKKKHKTLLLLCASTNHFNFNFLTHTGCPGGLAGILVTSWRPGYGINPGVSEHFLKA